LEVALELSRRGGEDAKIVRISGARRRVKDRTRVRHSARPSTQGDRTMRKTFAPALVLTLLTLGIAGVAWAVQAGVEAPQNPAVAAPAPGPSALAEGTASGEVSLEGLLLPEPVEMQGGCCVAACRAEWNACNTACGGDPACQTLCAQELEACKAGC
jgi:hypothetical protein